ncbi:hypothetical protein B0H10DRAFT_2301687 [Mycena sp. CBHHK59/15]|nr:hypothetical protein B0H10DRAFT_2301687 [Mycena sp. CBHHK59/15]
MPVVILSALELTRNTKRSRWCRSFTSALSASRISNININCNGNKAPYQEELINDTYNNSQPQTERPDQAPSASDITRSSRIVRRQGAMPGYPALPDIRRILMLMHCARDRDLHREIYTVPKPEKLVMHCLPESRDLAIFDQRRVPCQLLSIITARVYIWTALYAHHRPLMRDIQLPAAYSSILKWEIGNVVRFQGPLAQIISHSAPKLSKSPSSGRRSEAPSMINRCHTQSEEMEGLQDPLIVIRNRLKIECMIRLLIDIDRCPPWVCLGEWILAGFPSGGALANGNWTTLDSLACMSSVGGPGFQVRFSAPRRDAQSTLARFAGLQITQLRIRLRLGDRE